MKSYDVIDIYELVLDKGRTSSPRGERVTEVQYFQGTIENPWSLHPVRKYDIDYFKREFQWFLTGDKYNLEICQYATMWAKLIQHDGSILSNYGQYWWGPEQSGFEWVIDSLERDPDSRQAYIPMNNASHAFASNKDFVCTKGIQFRINSNLVDMHVSMRSTDVIYGMGTDLPCFYHLWMMVCSALHKNPGKFVFSSDSIHIYEKHLEMVEEVVRTPQYWELPPVYPPLTDAWDLIGQKYETPFGRWLKEAPL